MRSTFSIGLTLTAAAAAVLLSGCAMAPAAPAGGSHLDTVQKAAALRICTPGDYKPFSFQKADGSFEGIDVDLMAGFSASLGAKPEWVKTTWANLLPDLSAGKCDIAVGGVSVTTDRQKRAFFSAPYMVNGKAPIARVVSPPPSARARIATSAMPWRHKSPGARPARISAAPGVARPARRARAYPSPSSARTRRR